jgi:hypothetical protein
MGGISTNSGCLVLVLSSTDALVVSWNGGAGGLGGLVFGTLLGPEATGPWFMAVPCLFGVWLWGVVFVCFWFPGCTGHARCVCGVCGLGLLFENYIVDASIFYKKQFPRI